jgi:DnaK suppressor protein
MPFGAVPGGGGQDDAVPAEPDPPSIRAALDGARRSALALLASLSAEFDDMVDAAHEVNNDDEHDPEGATIAFERQQVASLIERTRRHLSELDDALARVGDGTYGVCETCGSNVGDERLAAQPAARTCVRCASGPPRPLGSPGRTR